MGGSDTETINLHGLGLAEARERLPAGMEAALRHGERVVRIIHGQGKHSAVFPVVKSFVRRWLEESDLARGAVEAVYRGEDGSPYTRPNPGETVVVLRGEGPEPPPAISWKDEEEREARRHARKMRSPRRRGTR